MPPGRPGRGGASPEQQTIRRDRQETFRRLGVFESILREKGVPEEEIRKRIMESLKQDDDPIGWFNETSDLHKVNAAELTLIMKSLKKKDEHGRERVVTKMDFLRTHKKMTMLLEANIGLGGSVDGKELSDIYEAIKYGGADGIQNGILVNKIDEHGDLTGSDVDLYDVAHLTEIKKMYSMLDPRDLPPHLDTVEKLEQAYYDGTALDITTKIRDDEGNELLDENGQAKEYIIGDLRYAVNRIAITKEEFEDYYDMIQENQTGFQMLANLRDQAIKQNHSENGGHAQFLNGLGTDMFYTPVSGSMAGSYVRVDVNKTDSSHRAAEHVHALGGYEENTGTLTFLERNAIRIWRGDVMDYHAHRRTRTRTFKNLMGMNSDEDAMIDAPNKQMWFGRREVDGKVQRGLIYKAMHKHYDNEMEKRRGYKMRDVEAGDRIITDVIAIGFAVNPRDFVMNFAKASGLYEARAITTGQTLQREEKLGNPKMTFYGKRPRGRSEIKMEGQVTGKGNNYDFSGQQPPQGLESGADWDYGEFTIHGFTALAYYLQWRVDSGDIADVPPGSKLQVNFVKEFAGEKDEDDEGDTADDGGGNGNQEQGDTPEQWEMDHTDHVDLFADIFNAYGDHGEALLDLIGGGDGVVNLGDGGGTIANREDFRSNLEQKLTSDDGLMSRMNSMTGEHLPRAAAQSFLTRVDRILRGRDRLSRQALLDKMAERRGQ